MPTKLNFKIYQGSTFKETLRWESATKKYIPITAPAHGLPVGWRVKVTNVVGMKELNSDDTYNLATSTTTDTITLNAVNSLGYTAYASGGVIEYNEPVSLVGYTARMQLRSSLEDTTTLLELTTENSGITINSTLCTITLNVSAADTAAMGFGSAVYSLELISGTGEVVTFCNGNISLIKEVTR
jgi:hypothetical protein